MENVPSLKTNIATNEHMALFQATISDPSSPLSSHSVPSLGLLNQITPYQLARLDPKSIQTLVDIGGITVLLNVGTDPERGLSTVDENIAAPSNASFDDRKHIYGENVLPTLLQLIWAEMKYKFLVRWLSNTFAVRTTHMNTMSHFNF